VIFLDEPTIGLDVVARQKMRDLVRSINQQAATTVFLTSHDTGDIENLCKRVIMINHGDVVVDQPMAQLKRSYLHRKIIRVRLEQSVDTLPTMAGVQVLKHKGAGLKLSLDTDALTIDDLYMCLRQVSPIADITIGDPPLEDIIASIYTTVSSDPTQQEVRDDETSN